MGEEHHYTEAYETLVKAREVAYGIGHDELVCRTGTFMAKLTANVGLDPATSTLELGLANACAERINARSVLLRADLLEARGLLALAADPAAAVQWHSAALALRGEYLGDLNHHTVKSVHNLANALAAGRRRDAARQRYDEALARYEQLFGPDHVEVADVLFDLGEFLRETAPDEARSLLARASVIYARHLPIRGLASANIHIMLALIDLNGAPAEGVLAAAAEHLQQARALQRDAALGPYHPDRALLSRADGELALRQGAFPAAAQAFERATWLLARHGVSDAEIYDSILDGVEAHFGDGNFVVIARRAHDEGPAFLDHLMSVEPASRRGLTAWYIGDSLARESFPAESVAYLQVARAVYEAHPDPANVAELGWMIAQAIGAIPARRDEARGLAIASLAHYEGVSDRAMAAQISRWLERNAPGPRPTTSEP